MAWADAASRSWHAGLLASNQSGQMAQTYPIVGDAMEAFQQGRHAKHG